MHIFFSFMIEFRHVWTFMKNDYIQNCIECTRNFKHFVQHEYTFFGVIVIDVIMFLMNGQFQHLSAIGTKTCSKEII
jgi:hypothetical protein